MTDRGPRLRLELFVEDVGASIAFYTRVLAFEVARHEPGDYASLRLGDVVLGIGPVAKLPEEGGYFGRGISGHRRGLGV
jgi:lactoylglutathione lyase